MKMKVIVTIILILMVIMLPTVLNLNIVKAGDKFEMDQFEDGSGGGTGGLYNEETGGTPSTINPGGTPSTINPGEWKPSNFNPNDMDEVVDAAGIIVSVIRTLGIIVSVIVLLIIGIKYMVGSVEERADYKTSMRPYLIGVLIFFGLSQFLAVIIDIVPGLF